MTTRGSWLFPAIFCIIVFVCGYGVCSSVSEYMKKKSQADIVQNDTSVIKVVNVRRLPLGDIEIQLSDETCIQYRDHCDFGVLKDFPIDKLNSMNGCNLIDSTMSSIKEYFMSADMNNFNIDDASRIINESINKKINPHGYFAHYYLAESGNMQ